MKLIQIIKIEMEIDMTDNNGNTCCFVKFFLFTSRVTHNFQIDENNDLYYMPTAYLYF